MKKALMRTTVLAAIAALMVVPVSFASGAQPNDKVVGGGQHAGGSSFGISAHSESDGTDAKGSITGETAGPEASIHAEVICLVVSGNEAIITGVLNQPEAERGNIIVVHTVDNGNTPGSGSPDLLRGSFASNAGVQPDPNNPGCFVPIFPPVPVEKGDIQVIDAP